MLVLIKKRNEMINGFEKETHELTDYEMFLLPKIVIGLKTKVGETKAITNKEMVDKLRLLDYKVNPARIRKIINYIRINRLIINLVSSSKGYWVENNIDRIKSYIESLEQRANEIQRVANSFK